MQNKTVKIKIPSKGRVRRRWCAGGVARLAIKNRTAEYVCLISRLTTAKCTLHPHSNTLQVQTKEKTEAGALVRGALCGRFQKGSQGLK